MSALAIWHTLTVPVADRWPEPRIRGLILKNCDSNPAGGARVFP
jgi:hypothetical protein